MAIQRWTGPWPRPPEGHTPWGGGGTREEESHSHGEGSSEDTGTVQEQRSSDLGQLTAQVTRGKAEC